MNQVSREFLFSIHHVFSRVDVIKGSMRVIFVSVSKVSDFLGLTRFPHRVKNMFLLKYFLSEILIASSFLLYIYSVVLKKFHFIVKHSQTWYHLHLFSDFMFQSWLQGGGNNSCKSLGLTSRFYHVLHSYSSMETLTCAQLNLT